MNEKQGNELPWLEYMQEFRKRLLACLFVVAGLFIVLFPFASSVYQLLAAPLVRQLPPGITLIATSLISPVWVPIKLIMFISLLAAVPVFLFQLWRFVASALYPHEKRWFWVAFGISLVLFYTGVAFTYWVIFPFLFHFLIHAAPVGVNILPDIDSYLDFALQLFLAFGLIAEIPLIIVLLIVKNILSVDTLASQRPYIIVGAFIVGMLLAPPDVLSQCLLAIPLWILFEIGLVTARWIKWYQK